MYGFSSDVNKDSILKAEDQGQDQGLKANARTKDLTTSKDHNHSISNKCNKLNYCLVNNFLMLTSKK